MARGWQDGLWACGGRVQTGGENRLDRGVAHGVVGKGPPAGRFEPVTAKSALEAKHPQGGPVALLGVGPVAHQSFDEDSDVMACAARPGDQIVRGHATVTLVRRWHVLLDRGMTAARAPAGVDRYAVMVVEDLDHPVCQADVDTSADQAVRHGIEAVQDIDVLIGMNLGLLPFGVFEGFRWKLAQGGPLDLVEQIAA